jgi:hypothetical protein
MYMRGIEPRVATSIFDNEFFDRAEPANATHREFPPSENQAHDIHQTKVQIFDILDELRVETGGLLKVGVIFFRTRTCRLGVRRHGN